MNSRFGVRNTVFALLATMVLGVPHLSGQTAPQLLPYTVKLIAGGGSAVIGSGATCPLSGYKSSDAYGDGCLATEIEIGNTVSGGNTPGARSAVADAAGNVFFTDYNNGLVRRVDVLTGIVTAVAGGGTITAGTSSGQLGTAVLLSHPAGIVFAPNGDLYFSDIGKGQVFKISATAGVITTTGTITLVAGNSAGTYGYASSTTTGTTITPPTGSYLHYPYGLAFDSKGDLFIADEYTEAILVLNTNASGTNVVNGVSIPAGAIWKIVGTYKNTSGVLVQDCTNGSGTSCTYGQYVENATANLSLIDAPYSVAVGPDGTVFSSDEYYDSVFKVSTSGIISTFAGIQNSVGTKPTVGKRGTAGSFGIGSSFGAAADTLGNVYITDASSGAIWRVDAAGLSQYVVAGGATTVCSGATDTNGDGCPGPQAIFGHSGTGNYATATLPGPGIYGISVDAYSNLYVGDTETNLIREVASGTQFGPVGNNQPTQTVDIHFAKGDSPASSNPFTLTSGSSIFILGTPNCTVNSDTTEDCTLPITASPTTLGAFSGTLTVASTLGGTANFPLNGTFVMSPFTRTSVAVTSSNCSGTTVYSPSYPLTMTATVNSTGTATGTVTFYANGTQIGTPQTLTNGVATLSYTFSQANSYAITAIYSGDSYYKTSTSALSANFTISNPTFGAAVVSNQENSVYAGGTALYSINLNQSVYTGTITFACSGLPANSSCVFNPSSISGAGCSITNTVAVSIVTAQGNAVLPASLGSRGQGLFSLLMSLLGVVLVLAVRLQRNRISAVAGRGWMVLALVLVGAGLMGCNNSVNLGARTPAGSYNVTVTATGSTGTVATVSVPLTVK